MDINLSQTGNVILVSSNGQSFILENDSILNTAPCSESGLIGTTLQSLQPNTYSFNLNCENNDAQPKENTLSTNQQIVAILNENQSQTFEITAEQAAQLGLHFDGNDPKKKLILSGDSLSSISIPNSQGEVLETSCNAESLFNTNFNLSIVDSQPAVIRNNDEADEYMEPSYSDTANITLESDLTVENRSNSPDCSFLMQFNAKLDDKLNTHSSRESELTESISDPAPTQDDLLAEQTTDYDSIFMKDSIYNAVDSVASLPETVQVVKKKKVIKKPRDNFTTDIRKNFKNLSRIPSAIKNGVKDTPLSIDSKFSSDSALDRYLEGADRLSRNLSDSSNNALNNSNALDTNGFIDVPSNAPSLPKDTKKSKTPSTKVETSKNAEKQSKQESDERLDVTVNAQSLTKEQLKQIAQVFSKNIMFDTKAPSKNVLYDPETNTRIICRVVYPEDLCKKKNGDTALTEGEKKESESNKNNLKKKGRRVKLKDDSEKAPSATKTESKNQSSSNETKKLDDTGQNAEKPVPVQVSCTTRSGRVSRPPRHMGGNETPFSDDANTTSFQSVTAQSKPETKTFESLPDVVSKKRNVSAEFKCPTCERVYLGQTKMAHHFEKNPTHGNMEKWNETLQSLKKNNNENNFNKASGDAGCRPNQGSGNKKGKKRRTYEQCKILLKKALEDCSKADVTVLAGPIVASMLSVWEFLVLRSARVKLESENLVLALLRELKLLLNHIKSSAEAFISPMNCSTTDLEASNEIEIRDDITSHVLGLPFGKYRANNNYENIWLKSFSEQSKKLMESNVQDLKRSKPNLEELNLWPNDELNGKTQTPSIENFAKEENNVNASNLLLSDNNANPTADFMVSPDKMSNEFVDEIMSQRLETLRTQQQNELNDCFTSVDDLINNLSVNIGSMAKTANKNEANSMINSYGNVNLDKCDTSSLDLNFVSFQRNNDIMNDFNVISSLSDEQSSINRNLNFVESSSACRNSNGPCPTTSLLSSSVAYVDDSSLYDNISSNLQFNNSDVITNVSSSTEDLMKSFVGFELRPNDSSVSLNFDTMNQYSPVVMHDEGVSASATAQLHTETYSVATSGFDGTVNEIGSLVAPRGTKVDLKAGASDDLDFVHSLDCLNPSI